MEAVTEDSYATSLIYLSVNSLYNVRKHKECMSEAWREASARAKHVDLTAEPAVKLVMSREEPTRTSTKSQKKKSRTTTQPMPTLSTCHFVDPNRELKRHTWQWFDYTCKNCGTTWPRHSTTVSVRQTIVSRCLKNKQACAKSRYYASMMAGERWLTPTHTIDRPFGELNLTPNPEIALAAEAEGKIVCINPVNGSHMYFVPGSREGLLVQFNTGVQ